MNQVKNIFYCLLMVSFCGCSQNKTAPIMQNPEITEKNIVNKLASNIQHYDYEPTYQLLIANNWCSSEILDNDMLVYKNFREPLDGPTVDINNYIFKSGVQTVTVRMYPVGKYKDENFDTFIAETGMSIIVNEYDEKTEQDKEIAEYLSPIKKELNEYNQSQFVGVGKTYYEANFTFNATIPYEVDGFDNAHDLRKLDKDMLEKKLLIEYNKLKDIYQNKDYDNIARTSYNGLKNQVISKYQNREYINDVWTMLMDAYKLPTFEMQPIEN